MVPPAIFRKAFLFMMSLRHTRNECSGRHRRKCIRYASFAPGNLSLRLSEVRDSRHRAGFQVTTPFNCLMPRTTVMSLSFAPELSCSSKRDESPMSPQCTPPLPLRATLIHLTICSRRGPMRPCVHGSVNFSSRTSLHFRRLRLGISYSFFRFPCFRYLQALGELRDSNFTRDKITSELTVEFGRQIRDM